MSDFNMVSMGMVLEDKKVNSWDIIVKPIETNGYSNGTVNTEEEEHLATGVDRDGTTYIDKVYASAGVTAVWYPADAHLVSAPDVCKGELVELWRYGDSDTFYWKASNKSTHLRKQETRTIAISNKPEVDKKPLDHTNSYYAEICTRTKTITIGTSTNDGEKHKYTIQVNAKTGYVVIEDNSGNNIYLDSVNHKVSMESSKGSSISVGDNIDIVSKGKININGKDVSTKGNLTNNGTNVGNTHTHIEQGDGKPVSVPR